MNATNELSTFRQLLGYVFSARPDPVMKARSADARPAAAELPDWFETYCLDRIQVQPDHAKLLETADRVWPFQVYVPEAMTLRNRAKWYESIVNLRKGSGWILDNKIMRKAA